MKGTTRRADRSTQLLRTPQLASVTTSKRIASYSDVRGAALAVEHLLGRGFEPRDVQVRPAELRIRPIALAPVPDEPRRLGVVIVALLTVALWTRWHGATSSQLLLAITAAALVGGLAYAAEAGALRLRRRRRRRAGNTVVARRFEVLVARDHQRAEHELARWWDPEAPPAAWSGPDVGHATVLPSRRGPTAIAA